MKLVAASSNQPLAKAIAKHLKLSLCKADLRRFADGEVFVEIQENVRGEDVFVIQSTSAPANEHVMELLIVIDALKRASAKRITAVMPYYGYARQDRKLDSRQPISAKLLANLLTAAGANRVLTMELHSGQIQGFFDIPTDNLSAVPVFSAHIRKNFQTKNLRVVSPDVGGVARARHIANRLGVGLAIIDKRRPRAGKAEVMNIIGTVEGYDCLMVDDIIDSGGTLCKGADAIVAAGAKSVSAYITHGVLSNGAAERVAKSSLNKLFITDTIQLAQTNKKIQTLTVAPLIGEAIQRIAKSRSVSSLFD